MNPSEMRSELGLCVSVLFHKSWGRTPVGGRLRSRTWWENRREELINAPTVVLPLGPDYNPLSNIVVPIPFEEEMGLDKELSQHWLPWLQQIFKRRYEQ